MTFIIRKSATPIFTRSERRSPARASGSSSGEETRYPSRSIAPPIEGGAIRPGRYEILAVSEAYITLARTTPGWEEITFSMSQEQEEHHIPSMW